MVYFIFYLRASSLKFLLITVIFLQPVYGIAQVSKRDSIRVSAEDTVYTKSSFGAATGTVTKTRDYQPASNKNSLVQLLNTIPGVRMEERSPGSYRINMRGSSLRSPFGVRNVKVYWNDIPLTDPGGNTYFNQLAFNNINTITLEKSTSSTIYGSGTGGQIIVTNTPSKKSEAMVELSGGSYGSRSLLASATGVDKNAAHRISYAYNAADGYREQSALRRNNLSWLSRVKLSDKQQLLIGVLFVDMRYQTPGGLNWKEYLINPRSARPAAGAFPSAVDAKAAILQKNLTTGVTYTNKFNSSFSNTTTVYGSYNRIENSAIRNFEKRNEPHYGGRSVFTFNKEMENGNNFDVKAGIEAQSGRFNIKVFGNRNGNADTLQTNDDVNTTTYSLFSGVSFTIRKKWNYTASLSYNKSRLGFKRLSDETVRDQPFSFSTELVPRLGVLRWIGSDLNIAALVSKGFSPPTVAELLPSTGIINTNLQAEKGWNYELILRAFPVAGLSMEASLFSFRLKDAIVQRRDEAGADYFTNAGGTRQKGVELSGSYNYNLFKGIAEDGFLRASYTYNFFKYDHFIKAGENLSGKFLPGLPASTFSVINSTYFKGGVYYSLSYYGASSVFLDDANTVSARPYHLLMAKLGVNVSVKKLKINVYVGADNLLNENYSLGNDINAVSGRYYNAAPRRNYYAGAAFSLMK